jgi:Flp pilus assembly protein protease CpaA
MAETCYMIAFSAAAAGIYTDLKHSTIPDGLNITLLVSALTAAALLGFFPLALFAALGTFSLFFLLGLALGGIGGGDIKLMAGIGAILVNPMAILTAIALAFCGSAFWAKKTRVNKIKMAPWLVGASFASFWAF